MLYAVSPTILWRYGNASDELLLKLQSYAVHISHKNSWIFRFSMFSIIFNITFNLYFQQIDNCYNDCK